MNRLPARHLPRQRRLLAEQLEDRRLLAGPYAPAADQPGSTAIAKDAPSIVAWATGVLSYLPGSNVDAEFQTAGNAIGPATGNPGDIVSLGRGGQMTVTFDVPIADGAGPDFAVFENGFSDTFLELGFVEVSSDGTNFFRFNNDSLTPSAVNAFGSVDPTEINNLAGKYRQGFGTPFDLAELTGISPLLDPSNVTQIRLIDIVGDGSQFDTSGDPIYDPYPTVGSAGMDVDAVGVIHQASFVRDVIGFEDVGSTLAAGSAWRGPVPGGMAIVGPFEDTVVIGSFQSETLTFNNAHSIDFGSWNQFAYSNTANTTTPGYTNQFSSFAGGGAGGSATFGIGFPDQSNFFDPPAITRETADRRRFDSLMLTNTTYAALSMRDGDSFAKQFGGADGSDPDFLLLTITGKDSNNTSIGTIEFYLADYRFADDSLDYIVDDWVEVDLSPVAHAQSLQFAVTSSDIGGFGINTPAYFAVDNITLAKPVLQIGIADREVLESDGANATIVRISRPDIDTVDEVVVGIAPVNPDIAIVPRSVTIPAGQPFVEFPIGVVNNDLVDGDRLITLEASADGFVGTSRMLTVQDDDVRQLTLTLDQSALEEGSSIVSTVVRNDGDLSAPLTLQIESTQPSLLSFGATATIAAGQTSTTFAIMAVEDSIDRPDSQASISVSALDHVGASALLEVTDNDQPTVSIEVEMNTYSESEATPSAGIEDVGRHLAPSRSTTDPIRPEVLIATVFNSTTTLTRRSAAGRVGRTPTPPIRRRPDLPTSTARWRVVAPPAVTAMRWAPHSVVPSYPRSRVIHQPPSVSDRSRSPIRPMPRCRCCKAMTSRRNSVATVATMPTFSCSPSRDLTAAKYPSVRLISIWPIFALRITAWTTSSTSGRRSICQTCPTPLLCGFP